MRGRMENSSEIRFFSEFDLLHSWGQFLDTIAGVCHRAKKKQISRRMQPHARTNGMPPWTPAPPCKTSSKRLLVGGGAERVSVDSVFVERTNGGNSTLSPRRSC